MRTSSSLDHTNCFRGNEKDIVSPADVGLLLANGDPKPCAEIDGLFVLNNPTASARR
jgi:hypothetical protein